MLSYVTTGEVLFSYLRKRGKLNNLRPMAAARMSLEFNFVNHVLPSGGAAGLSYIGWKLGHYGISGGISTMGQMIRFVLLFVSFITLLTISVLVLVFLGEATPLIFWLSGGLIVATFTIITLFLTTAGNRERLTKFGARVAKFVNGLVRRVTFGRKKEVISDKTIAQFTHDVHEDYLEMSTNRKVLIVPLLWSFVANLADVSLFYIAFAALGNPINPAVVLIAYGLSSIIAIAVITPGGAGVYEAVMIGFLASAGVPFDVAIAGTLLARVILLLGTIILGYVFYQNTILRFGKVPLTAKTETQAEGVTDQPTDGD